MKTRWESFGDALLVGYILMVGSLIYMQEETSLFVRAILAIGLLIIWLIFGGFVFGVFRIMWKTIPEAESIMEREHDERAQKLNMQARTYAGRVLQILLVILAILLFVIYNEILISLILFVLCGLYDLLGWIIRKKIEN
ncbi:MAG: hypothetical protein ACRC3H_22560 [Lachnospiraceae bacterium]